MRDDLISRQAAIECLEHLSACDEPFVEIGTDDETFIGKYKAITEISDLPSAQHEIIYCKDCKHYKAYEYTGRLACHYVIGGTVVRNLNDFCSRAERITDE